MVGAGLQGTQQLSGFNTLMYYSASIFAALGYRNATAVGLLIALVNFGFTLIALQVSVYQEGEDLADDRLWTHLGDEGLCSILYLSWLLLFYWRLYSSTVSSTYPWMKADK